MEPHPPAAFPNTRWTHVERVRSGNPEVSSAALGELCRQYRYPLYCYLRRRGLSHPDAEDVLHDFIARFLRLEGFQRADETRGRLRGFLTTSLDRHLADWYRNRARQPETSVDPGDPEWNRRYESENLPRGAGPDEVLDRIWAGELLEASLERTRVLCESRGRSELFAKLRPVLLAGGSLRGHDAPGIAASLSMTEVALRAALHRLLRDFGEQLRAEVAKTLGPDGDVNQEIEHLRALFAA